MAHMNPMRTLRFALVFLSLGFLVLNLDIAHATPAFVPGRAPSTVTISSSLNPSSVGQPVTLTISVMGNGVVTPTGWILTTVDGVNYGCIEFPLNSSGQATCVIRNFNAGTHSVSAVYSGDSTYTGGTSNTITQFVSANHARGLFVSNCGMSTVNRYNASTGAFVSTFASGSSLACPGGLAFGPDGNLYVSSYGSGVLRYSGFTGDFIDTFLPSNVISLSLGLAMDGQGNLYVGNALYSPFDVKRRDHTTGLVTTLDAPSNYKAEGIITRSDGHVFISDNLTSKFLHFDNAGTYISGYTTTNVNNPVGNALGADGLLYVAGNPGVIGRYDPNTGAYLGSFAVGLDSPWGIAFGPDGNLYVASRSNNNVVRLDGMTGASLGTFVSAGSGDLSSPQFLTFAPLLTTTLGITSALNPASTGQPVTFTATVSETTPLTPTGTIAFKSGGVTIPGCALQPLNDSRQATCTTANLTGGTHIISAVYSGDMDFATSSAVLTPDQVIFNQVNLPLIRK